MLLLLLLFNKVEHAALGVLLQDMKVDLSLTDTQLGLLSGIAFTLFYATMGVPIARWADRGNRVTILSITTALQCGALALSGLAANFVQLLVIRIGVAVGEAGCVAPANSLIADYFARTERARATAWFMLGYPLSAVVGYFAGGWLNEHYGWRATFITLGLPGLALAVLAYATLREPRRGRSVPTAASPASPTVPPAAGLKEVVAALWSNTSFRHLVIGYSLVTFFAIGMVLWAPTFFKRTYGLQTGELGLWMAVIWGAGGLAGTYFAAELASRHAVENEALQVRAIALVFGCSGLLAAAVYVSSSLHVSLALLTLIAAVNYGTAGPLFATIQTLVPDRMRAVAVATTYLFTNLIGVGLGPLAVGVLSDWLRPFVGEDSLRYALLALCPGYLWAAWHLWRASVTVSGDVLASQAFDASRAVS
jgi:MFS family permease